MPKADNGTREEYQGPEHTKCEESGQWHTSNHDLSFFEPFLISFSWRYNNWVKSCGYNLTIINYNLVASLGLKDAQSHFDLAGGQHYGVHLL
jgi:hypothetical protein